jgi:hypothetical protein
MHSAAACRRRVMQLPEETSLTNSPDDPHSIQNVAETKWPWTFGLPDRPVSRSYSTIPYRNIPFRNGFSTGKINND